MLNDNLARVLGLLAATLLVAILSADVGEVDVAVANDPAAVVGELDDVTLGVKEEERLCGADGETGVGALAATGDLGPDLVLENLWGDDDVSVRRKRS